MRCVFVPMLSCLRLLSILGDRVSLSPVCCEAALRPRSLSTHHSKHSRRSTPNTPSGHRVRLTDKTGQPPGRFEFAGLRAGL